MGNIPKDLLTSTPAEVRAIKMYSNAQFLYVPMGLNIHIRKERVSLDHTAATVIVDARRIAVVWMVLAALAGSHIAMATAVGNATAIVWFPKKPKSPVICRITYVDWMEPGTNIMNF